VIFFGKLVHSAKMSACLQNQFFKKKATGSDDVG
jgi:hypothetical protein